MALESPVLYYKLNLKDPDAESSTVESTTSTKEDYVIEVSVKTPTRRSWLDDVTANSLERRQKKNRPRLSPRTRPNECHSLPRNTKLFYGWHSQPSPEISRLRSSSLATSYSSSRQSPTSSLSDINLALNNLLPQREVNEDGLSPEVGYMNLSLSACPTPSPRKSGGSNSVKKNLHQGSNRISGIPYSELNGGKNMYFDMTGTICFFWKIYLCIKTIDEINLDGSKL